MVDGRLLECGAIQRQPNRIVEAVCYSSAGSKDRVDGGRENQQRQQGEPRGLGIPRLAQTSPSQCAGRPKLPKAHAADHAVEHPGVQVELEHGVHPVDITLCRDEVHADADAKGEH